ncbi:MAG: hypothetical protein GY820_21085 [Gammaproteobacteria bacterium]|nr:hypothetical protein [Gammaproteobacteria bacterium]
MSFYKASKKSEDVKQGGNSYITKSGFWPVKIIAAIVNTSKGGSQSIDLYVDHAGQKQIVYGNLRIYNNDGSSNKIGAKIFNQLIIIAGLDDVAEPVERELPIGKDGKMEDCAVLEDLCNIDCVMRTQMEYNSYEGNIQEKKVIKAFFRAEDNATAEEIVNESTPGAGYEREQKYTDKITLKDGITEAMVTQWIADKRPSGTARNGGNVEKPSFTKRRFGKASGE